MELKDYLLLMIVKSASDLYFTTGAPPSARINGDLTPLQHTPLKPGYTAELADSIMSDDQKAAFKLKPEMNLAISETGIGRFRVNIFRQRNETSLVIRHIKMDIPSLEELALPRVLNNLVLAKRGLILVTGACGVGKSTTLAAMIKHRSKAHAGHIITIEDPIEFAHNHDKSIINQREIGLDTNCLSDALENSLRQSPDVIVIGEIRDRETMEHALHYADSGHLCLATMHSSNAVQTIERIVHFFPKDQKQNILSDLAVNLRAVVGQRLVPDMENGRVPAIEVLLSTPLTSELIKQDKVDELPELMEKSEAQGMQSFDMALHKLYEEGKISLDNALRQANSENNLRIKIKSVDAAKSWDSGQPLPESKMTLVHDEEDEEEHAGTYI